MGFTVIDSLANGVVLNMTSLTEEERCGAPLKTFLPKLFSGIQDVELYIDRVVVNDVDGRSYSLDILGSNDDKPVNMINGVSVTTIDEIFDEFIAIL